MNGRGFGRGSKHTKSLPCDKFFFCSCVMKMGQKIKHVIYAEMNGFYSEQCQKTA